VSGRNSVTLFDVRTRGTRVGLASWKNGESLGGFCASQSGPFQVLPGVHQWSLFSTEFSEDNYAEKCSEKFG
jgi:hypothetical protein